MNKCRSAILSDCLILYDTGYYCNIRLFGILEQSVIFFIAYMFCLNQAFPINIVNLSIHFICIRHFFLLFLARYFWFLINAISDANIRLSSFIVVHYIGMHLIQFIFQVNLAYFMKTSWNFSDCQKSLVRLSIFSWNTCLWKIWFVPHSKWRILTIWAIEIHHIEDFRSCPYIRYISAFWGIEIRRCIGYPRP